MTRQIPKQLLLPVLVMFLAILAAVVWKLEFREYQYGWFLVLTKIPWYLGVVILAASLAIVGLVIRKFAVAAFAGWFLAFALTLCIVLNLRWFPAIDEDTPWHMRRIHSDSLHALASDCPANIDALPLYAFLQEHYADRSIRVPLQVLSTADVVTAGLGRIDDYDDAVTAEGLSIWGRLRIVHDESSAHLSDRAALQVLSLPHVAFKTSGNRQCIVTYPVGPARDLRVVTNGQSLFFLSTVLGRQTPIDGGECAGRASIDANPAAAARYGLLKHTVFLTALYVFGLVSGLLCCKKLPIPFICVSGFLWGTLAWGLSAAIALSMPLPFRFLLVVLLMGFGLAVAVLLHCRAGTWRLSRGDLIWCVCSVLVCAVCASIFSALNFSLASRDSIVQILIGRTIAYEGLTSRNIIDLTSRGILLPVLHSVSVSLGGGYLRALQPMFGVTLVACFAYLCRRAILACNGSGSSAAPLLTVGAAMTMLSSYLVMFQFFYIHNNLPAAVFLFVGVLALWFALVERNNSWLIAAMAALTGFCFLRTEAPLFVLLFLGLTLSAGTIPRRARILAVLPFIAIMSCWYVRLSMGAGAGTRILNPRNTAIIVGALVAFGGMVVMSANQRIEELLVRRLHVVAAATIGLVLVATFILKTEHMQESAYSLLRNMLSVGRWGCLWAVILGLLALSWANPAVPYERIFAVGIPCFFMLLLPFASLRMPFREGWGDSANRIITHILPITLVYIVMKFGASNAQRRTPEPETASGHGSGRATNCQGPACGIKDGE